MLIHSDNINYQHHPYLIFGGTGSLGTTLVRRLLESSPLHDVIVFSRDEAKHYKLRNAFSQHKRLRHFIGDVRNFDAVLRVMTQYKPAFIINAAAMKQVPLCEDFPEEAIKTNVLGAENIIRAAHAVASETHIIRVLSISTDKAVKPVNAYGCTKALQEKVHLNGSSSNVICNVVRYGNVLESTGSVIPFFKELLAQNKQLPVTDFNMSRFLLSLNEAVNLIIEALKESKGQQIFIPNIRSAYIVDVAFVMCKQAGKDPKKYIIETAIRPGEKLNEILLSEEETSRTELNRRFSGCIINWREPTEKIGMCEEDFSSGSSQNLLYKYSLTSFLREKGVFQCAQSESQGVKVS